MRRRLSLWSCALLLALSALGPVALAQQPEESIDDSRATSFVAVEGPQTEQVPGGSLMVGAYMFVLLLLVGYVARLGMLQRRTQDELERLSGLLDAQGGHGQD